MVKVTTVEAKGIVLCTCNASSYFMIVNVNMNNTVCEATCDFTPSVHNPFLHSFCLLFLAYIGTETRVAVKIVQTLSTNLLTSVDLS